MNYDLDEILASFSSVPYPGDENISIGASIEAQYVAHYFKGKRWSDLTVEALRNDYEGDPSACLSFMTHEAFRYFLPGYLKMALIQYDVADAIFDTVLFKLGGAANENTDLRLIVEGYNQAQLKAIAQYLQLLSAKICKFYPVDEAAAALDEFWGKYLD
jgi:hypothetical protein